MILAAFASGFIIGSMLAAVMASAAHREEAFQGLCCECHKWRARFCAHCVNSVITRCTKSDVKVVCL